MPWNNQGGQSGGPWGQGGGGGGPWGQGGGQNPQDVDAAIRQMKDAWGRMMPTGGGGMRSILLLFWCLRLSGRLPVFIGLTQQQGVVKDLANGYEPAASSIIICLPD